ncbi:MAG: cytochrome d ubiquinol oxidase subunit II [Rhizobiales bacterium]|nr:cytochrome d ubiquinol oxidase subunit II [Hyphomicrobiales bacterium]
MVWDLPLIWAAILGFAVVMYVVLDGFDLGLGLLFPFAKDESERDQMMASIKPFWDGNETWLVLGGGGLLVAFPRAYAILLPALYLPVIVMLLGLIFRGVAFEFRHLSHGKTQWNVAFAAGSAVAAVSQGMILGGMIQGIHVEGGAFAGGAFDWATPFALLCGFGVAAGYALLGATWLIMKTEGPVAERARSQAKVLLALVLAFMAAVSVWTPLAFPRIAERWFSLPNFYYLWPVPLLTALLALLAWRWIDRAHDATPFFAAIGLFLLGYLGLVISSFPYLVPPTLTIWDTAAARSSQLFMLVGTLFLMPFILGYTALAYWLFRGKVTEGEGYH